MSSFIFEVVVLKWLKHWFYRNNYFICLLKFGTNTLVNLQSQQAKRLKATKSVMISGPTEKRDQGKENQLEKTIWAKYRVRECVHVCVCVFKSQSIFVIYELTANPISNGLLHFVTGDERAGHTLSPLNELHLPLQNSHILGLLHPRVNTNNPSAAMSPL